MLGLLCPECSIVKIFTPCTRLYSCILQNNFSLLGILASIKMFEVGIVSFSLVKNLYFYIVMPTFAYIDVPNVHWQTIYCGKFTVEETGHFTWAMFGQHNTSITATFILSTKLSKHTLKVDETWLLIFDNYVFEIKMRYVCHMCGYGR